MSTYERDPNTGNLKQIDGMRSVDDVKALMLEFCYPIGSIYVSTKNVSPQTFLGGTWKSKSDYVLRGATSGVNFDSDTNDGGADSLTVSSVASHNHTQNAHSHYTVDRNNTWAKSVNSVATGNVLFNWSGSSGVYTSFLRDLATHAATATNVENGANYTVNTLPKYKNVYIWERTA